MKPVTSEEENRLTGLLRRFRSPRETRTSTRDSADLLATGPDSTGLVPHCGLTKNSAPDDVARELNARPALALDLLPRASVVYFARSAGLVKIGVSRTPRLRLQTLAAQSASAVDLIGFGFGNLLREQAVHEMLAHARAHGEWFAPCTELFAVIDDAMRTSLRWMLIGVPRRDGAQVRGDELRAHFRSLRHALIRRTPEAA